MCACPGCCMFFPMCHDPLIVDTLLPFKLLKEEFTYRCNTKLS